MRAWLREHLRDKMPGPGPGGSLSMDVQRHCPKVGRRGRGHRAVCPRGGELITGQRPGTAAGVPPGPGPASARYRSRLCAAAPEMPGSRHGHAGRRAALSGGSARRGPGAVTAAGRSPPGGRYQDRVIPVSSDMTHDPLYRFTCAFGPGTGRAGAWQAASPGRTTGIRRGWLIARKAGSFTIPASWRGIRPVCMGIRRLLPEGDARAPQAATSRCNRPGRRSVHSTGGMRGGHRDLAALTAHPTRPRAGERSGAVSAAGIAQPYPAEIPVLRARWPPTAPCLAQRRSGLAAVLREVVPGSGGGDAGSAPAAGYEHATAPADAEAARHTAVMADLHGVPGHDRGTARAVPERDAGGTVTGRVLVFCPACVDRLPSGVRGPHPGWGEAIAALHEHIGGGRAAGGHQAGCEG